MLKRSNLVGICVSSFVLLSWLLILFYKYEHFGYYDWDLAYFAQAMFNLSHGSTYASIFDANFFANHSNLISILLVPFYKVFTCPFFLVFLKVFSYVTAGYLIFLISKERLGAGIAVILMILYFCYPPNVFGLLYEFDFESIAPGLLVLLYFFYKKDNWIGFMVTAILVILIKENLPLIVAAFGLCGMVQKQKKFIWGVVPFLLGIISFVVLTNIIIPLAGSHALGNHPYMGHYSKFGNSFVSIVFNLIAHPGFIINKLGLHHNLVWIFEMIGPLIFMPLADFGSLVLVLPIFLMHLLSSAYQEHTIYYAYSLTMVPFLFLGTIQVLSHLKLVWQKKAFIIVIVLLVLLNLTAFWNYWPEMKGRYVVYNDNLTATSNEMLKLIPPQAPVIATFAFLSKLSQREHVYGFHKIYNSAFQNKDFHFKCPDMVKYALINFKDPWLMHALRDDPQAKGRVEAFLKDGGWKVVRSQEGIVLYER